MASASVGDTAQLGSDARELVKRKIGLPKRPGGCQWGIPAAVLKCFVGLNLNATNPDDLKGMSSCQWFRVDGEWSDEVTKLPKTLADAQIARWQSEYRRDSTDLGAEDPNTLSIAGNLATSLFDQGKYADAERIEREVPVYWRVTGLWRSARRCRRQHS